MLRKQVDRENYPYRERERERESISYLVTAWSPFGDLGFEFSKEVQILFDRIGEEEDRRVGLGFYDSIIWAFRVFTGIFFYNNNNN